MEDFGGPGKEQHWKDLSKRLDRVLGRLDQRMEHSPNNALTQAAKKRYTRLKICSGGGRWTVNILLVRLPSWLFSARALIIGGVDRIAFDLHSCSATPTSSVRLEWSVYFSRFLCNPSTCYRHTSLHFAAV